jgi:uncharacterized membrane protein YphA (DoxX/SURF4 family)
MTEWLERSFRLGKTQVDITEERILSPCVPPKFLPNLALALRVVLGAWFVYSGGEKLFVSGLSEFTRSVGNYRLLAAPWDAVLAYTLPWFELVAGLCLMLSVLRKGALLVISGLVVIFVVGVGYAWSQGLNIACGCRGGATAMNYGGKMAEFAGYAVVLVFLWAMERSEKAK